MDTSPEMTAPSVFSQSQHRQTNYSSIVGSPIPQHGLYLATTFPILQEFKEEQVSSCGWNLHCHCVLSFHLSRLTPNLKKLWLAQRLTRKQTHYQVLTHLFALLAVVMVTEAGFLMGLPEIDASSDLFSAERLPFFLGHAGQTVKVYEGTAHTEGPPSLLTASAREIGA